MPAPATTEAALWPPDYVAVLAWRQRQAELLRAEPEAVLGAAEFYRTRPVDFVNHWVITYDPRNAGGDLPARLPLVMFPKQEELVRFLHACVTAQGSGLIEKCRDMGATWVCCAFSVWLWLFWPGAAVGWGSRKEALVDKLGDADSIFEKIRMIVRGLPRQMWPVGFVPDEHMTYMRVVNPATGATITGEAGDNIGRGGRKLIYFKDESAHYERPEKIEASLSDNTRVQIDISSVNGLGNVFHRKREAGTEWLGGRALEGRTNVFVMDWRDHPATNAEWYETRREQAQREGLSHVFAQEVDRSYASSVEGLLIKPEWVKAAINAHVHLGFADDGGWVGALDVADEGTDRNALATRKGVVLQTLEEWGARDTAVTTRRAVSTCSGVDSISLQYDCVGMGAGVRAEANRLADDHLMPQGIRMVPWNAGSRALDPDGNVEPGDDKSPLNKDMFANLKAQAWWQVARMFERTWRARNDEGFTWTPEDVLSIPEDLPLLRQLEKELCQPTAHRDTRLRVFVDKAPSGVRSPNLADAFVMAYWPAREATSYDTSMSWV